MMLLRLRLTSVNWVSYANVFKPSLKILFLELLPEEYFELTMVFGWKLTAKSWLLRCGQFLPLVLYWALNKASSNITLNLLNMGIMMMTGIFILWSCIQNIWWTSVNTTLIWNLNTKAYLKCLSHFRWNDLLVKVLSSWLKSETKRWNLGLTLRPAFLNKTRDKKDVISTSPKQDFLLHATNIPTNTHLPTIKVYQTTKITKLNQEVQEPGLFQFIYSQSNHHKQYFYITKSKTSCSLIEPHNYFLYTKLRLQIPCTSNSPTPHIYNTYNRRYIWNPAKHLWWCLFCKCR